MPSLQPPSTGKSPRVPPEQCFWKRYSPNHEFPLSSVFSFAVYGLIAVALFVAVRLGDRWFGSAETLPIEPIAFAGGAPSGPNGPGEGGPGGLHENIPQPPEAELPADLKPKVPLTTIKRDPIKIAELPDLNWKDEAFQRYIAEANVALSQLGQVQAGARSKLMEGLQGPGGPGGPSGPGGPAGPSSARQRRMARWVIDIQISSADDYRRQLLALGAIVAVPAGGDKYQVIRDLRGRPQSGPVEDLASIKRFPLVDGRPESVRHLATALGLPQTPSHIIVFLPETLEKVMLDREKAFKGRPESEILETKFVVVKRGTTYTPLVVDQR